jgi:hypothetical protein
MLTALAQIYVSLMPAILAGILNMAWVKTPMMCSWAKPIDGGRTMRDGRRIFGDHKTWKGFAGMVGLGAICGLAWGALTSSTGLAPYNLFQTAHAPTPEWNAATGALLGLAYGLFELPNSFLKRRVGITPGKTHGGAWTILFVVLDQIDSVIGCALVFAATTSISLAMVVGIIVVGGVTHVVLNLLLYAAKLRDNPL